MIRDVIRPAAATMRLYMTATTTTTTGGDDDDWYNSKPLYVPSYRELLTVKWIAETDLMHFRY